MRATIVRAATMIETRREVLFEDIYERQDMTNYDVIPGDKELLMIQKIVPGKHVGIVMDWPALLVRTKVTGASQSTTPPTHPVAP